MVGAELRLAVAVEPENVNFQFANAVAASVVRLPISGAGAPDETAVIVADMPVGQLAPVTSESVPETPFEEGIVALFVLLGATLVVALPGVGLGVGVGVGVGAGAEVWVTEGVDEPPHPAKTPMRTAATMGRRKERVLIMTPRSRRAAMGSMLTPAG
jgi:hypothetical protein